MFLQFLLGRYLAVKTVKSVELLEWTLVDDLGCRLSSAAEIQKTLIVYLYNKRRYVCLSISMFRMASQTAGPIETKLDTRTHVHPGSVSVKVIHVCVRE